MYTNLINVQVIISLLKQYGISKLVLSPGTRNVPFVHSVETDPFFKCYSVVDERSAAYFALGLSEASGEPVCVSCTSSTAACNYMPAVKEAYEKNIPLIVLSADRDFHYLFQMEDQMIDQVDMYGEYVNCAVNLPIVRNDEDRWFCIREVNKALIELNHRRVGPVQINFQVIDPKTFTCEKLPSYRRINLNLPDKTDWSRLAKALSSKKRILVLCGLNWENCSELTAELEAFFKNTNSVISYDYFSNVRSECFLKTVLVTEAIEAEEFEDYLPDLVITLGSHLWSFIKLKLRAYHGSFEHWSISPSGKIEDAFRGLTNVFECEPYIFFRKINECISGSNDMAYYKKWKERIDRVKFPQIPFSNFFAVQRLMEHIPNDSLIHLTILNSIRLVQFCDVKNNIKCYANLGADGIDGCLSTFLGQSAEHKDKLCFLLSGDLSFLYDANGMEIPLAPNQRFFVINNFAGAEFHKNFDTKAIPMIDDFIAAGHKTKISDFVSDIDADYYSASNEEELLSGIERLCMPNSRPVILEIFTDAETDAKLLLKFYSINRDRSLKMKIRRAKQKFNRGIIRIKDAVRK
ncbi:MAG: 2-succinyl-5-enolpyruvyl-6-hydroxy-3-cyclohexene-1-carboxylic-acid synthase [Eubacterium sp.]|nr:2-succinyl-5-enolpyruvyl-6-hydroxy-3-cyclohexene-1-carboxylic-acid synthase [Eubacterium sp.]